MTIIYFVIALGILVLVHEWGHFIVARMKGIKVLKFSIGFGPKLFGFKKGDTEYKVSLIPLGGYVQMYGEDPESDAKGNDAAKAAMMQDPDSFAARPLRDRVPVVMAGPIMNLILACIFMPMAFMFGRMVPAFMNQDPVVLGVAVDSPAAAAGVAKGDKIIAINDDKMKNWEDALNWIVMNPDKEAKLKVDRQGTEKEFVMTVGQSPSTRQKMGYLGLEPFYFWGDDPIIGGFAPQSAAKEAGLQEKDLIVAIGGDPIDGWSAMTQKIRGGTGDPLEVTVRRNGQELKFTVTPRYDEANKAYLVGITKYEDPNYFIKKRYGLVEAAGLGFSENVKLTGLTAKVVGQLVTFQMSYKALGGPVQIAQGAAQAARSGVGDFFYFLAFLSLQLGIMNLLPIPVLDGGHLFFMGWEAILKRPVSLKIRIAAQQFGLALLLTLMVLVTFNDVNSVWGFANIWSKITGLF